MNLQKPNIKFIAYANYTFSVRFQSEWLHLHNSECCNYFKSFKAMKPTSAFDQKKTKTLCFVQRENIVLLSKIHLQITSITMQIKYNKLRKWLQNDWTKTFTHIYNTKYTIPDIIRLHQQWRDIEQTRTKSNKQIYNMYPCAQFWCWCVYIVVSQEYWPNQWKI